MNLLKRIYNLLLPEERKQGQRVVGAAFLAALLNFVGLASLLPVLYYLLDDSASRQSALWFCLLAGGVMAGKNVAIALLSRYQQRYLLSLYKRMSFSLFTAYYRRGLLFIREQGTNRLGYEVNAVCYAFSLNMLAPLLRICSDGLLIAMVVVALLVYDWLIALILLGAFVPFAVFYVVAIRKQVREYGKLELEARRRQSRIVNEAFGGYAELEVNGAFGTVKDAFRQGLEQITGSRLQMDTLMRLPGFLSEMSVIVGLTLMALCATGDVKALIGVFAVAAFRLLPALKGILSGWTLIQNMVSNLQIIEEGMKESSVETAVSATLPFEKEIAIERVSYTYNDDGQVLTDFSCRIRKGEYVGIKGYSGVGKSTLFNLLLGFLKPQRGTISIDGVPLTPEVQSAWLQQTGYVQQDVFIFQGTLAENVALGCRGINRERLDRVLQQVSLYDWVQTLPQGVDTLMGEYGGRLSGGQRQRIGIARALYKEAEVILLDEATSALDNATEREVNRTLHNLKLQCPGLTILSIAHRESSLEYCDRVIVMDEQNNEED